MQGMEGRMSAELLEALACPNSRRRRRSRSRATAAALEAGWRVRGTGRSTGTIGGPWTTCAARQALPLPWPLPLSLALSERSPRSPRSGALASIVKDFSILTDNLMSDAQIALSSAR